VAAVGLSVVESSRQGWVGHGGLTRVM